ncbi:xin actin-binding repeat-containing protein 1-like [Paralichthys olivaceus]|uniref:xin actin-binding repeat-containing protein 1-like n=1 Tax=Paralichthys olivaceus TaxID=8255 RepID=UPI0037517CF9
MDWKSSLRRTQSLKSVSSSSDKPTWTEAGLRDRKTSVSQLVSRYQTRKEVSASTQAPPVNNSEVKLKQVLKEITPSLEESKEIHLASLTKRNYEGEQSQAKPGLTRSRSMGSLQNGAGSIEALKARFESKAATQTGVRSRFRAAELTSPSKAAGSTPLMNGKTEEVKRSAEKQKTRNPPVNGTDAKENHVTRKVVNESRAERRKTIGGIDFEKIAAFQADEKRRSVADFRDSSFFQSKEKLSVKVLSALYLSKVAPQEPKLAQDQSPESGKRGKIAKMAEDPKQRKDEPPPLPLPRHRSGPADISDESSQKAMPVQISKEKLHQQRQKSELKRLLKHTHPELKMLDEAVDDELAEVLTSESGVAAGETGYEGEVFSRCLIFENCALSNKVSPHTSPTHMADGKVGDGFVGKTSAVFEEHEERPCHESVKGIVQDYKTLGSSPDPDRECEEEMIRIDVQASRRLFESQSVKTSWPNPDNRFRGKTSIFGEERGPVQKHKFEMTCKENVHSENKSLDLMDQPHTQGPCVQSTGLRFSGGKEVYTDEAAFDNDPTSPTVQGEFEEIIKTGAALFKNNPFISTNIERENSCAHSSKSQIPASPSEASGNPLITNVKNRAHLFESMPFDKIRHQNKDEIETMVENIKETLNSLYCVNALHSDGSIIEVNETMIAKKAKFILSESGPEIKYNELAEGGAQNFIVQLLPRANLKPHITYLKEDRKGGMEATVVNVPVHQHQFTTSQDTEFKTANVVQLIEDILNQDNSLRKGVIMQEDANKCADIIVYSLYHYVDEEDVKSYRAPPRRAAEFDEPETKEIYISKTENQGLRKGIIESTISSLLETSQDQTCTGSIRPEVTVKGNVKLFKSCIEKGDLEYLKTLQVEPIEQEQELDPNQTAAEQNAQLHYEQGGDHPEESSLDWVPVDVKRLKSMFSGDRQSQAKQNIHENLAPSTTISHTFTGQNVPLGKSQSCKESNIGVLMPVMHREDNVLDSGGQAQEEVCKFPAAPQGTYQHLVTQDDDRVHQAQIVKVVDESDEISNLQTAIHSLQQATMEAKYLYHSSQNKRKCVVQESSGQPIVSVMAGDVKELCQENKDQKVDSEPRLEEVTSASNFTSDKNTETCNKGTNSEEVQMTETCSKQGQKCTNVVQKHFETIADCSDTQHEQQEEDEVVFHGKLQQALASLERSNINVTRGDFKAAMIYQDSSRPHKAKSQNIDKASVQKPITEDPCPLTESSSIYVHLRQEDSEEQVTVVNAKLQKQNRPATTAVSEKSKRLVGGKPAIPPKPEHLKVKQIDDRSSNPKNLEATKTNATRPEIKEQSKEDTVVQPPKTSASCHDGHTKHQSKMNSGADTGSYSGNYKGETIQMSQKTSQFQGSFESTNKNTSDKPEEMNSTLEINPLQEQNPVKENMNESDQGPVNFNEACQKFGGKKSGLVRNAPVKLKRVKIAQSDNNDPNLADLVHMDPKPQQTITNPSDTGTSTSLQTAEKHGKEKKQQNKVEMRDKRGRTETEDERRQRLSVHMDEIVRGNIAAAMDIFDNLRKQEELRSILSRVEDIEQDTSEVDVRSLRGVFEDVPDWVVSSDKKKHKKVKVEHKAEKSPLKDHPQSKPSMAHIFGDLEKASEEIMNLKEQTLARLLDIEEAIKKALYSVSTLKSDSDIADLSCLFKESMGTLPGSPSTGSISKISIGSSRTKLPPAQESATTKGSTIGQGASSAVVSAKQRASPPSSPAFISIQSATRKTNKTDVVPPETTICPTCQQSPKSEEKFCTTKTLTCNSPAQNRKRDPRKGGQKPPPHSPLNPKRELSVLEVQTDHEGKSIIGTKTVTENYEQTDNFGNRIYSSKTSTVVTTQPETMTSFTGPAVVSPTTCQVTTHPEVRLPINPKL